MLSKEKGKGANLNGWNWKYISSDFNDSKFIIHIRLQFRCASNVIAINLFLKSNYLNIFSAVKTWFSFRKFQLNWVNFSIYDRCLPAIN